MKPRSLCTYFSIAVGAVALAGCTIAATTDGPPLSGARQSGSLGLATFQYPCDSSTLVCAQDGNAATFPTVVATGARFKLKAQSSQEPSSYALELSPIAKEQISTDPDGTLVALKPGWGGIELKKRGADETIDFAMLRIATPVKIGLFTQATKSAQSWQMTEIGTQLQVTGRTIVQAVLRDAEGEALAGEIPIDWKAADPSLVDVSVLARGRIEIVPNTKGTTELVAEGAGLKTTLKIQITQTTTTTGGGL